MRFTLTEPEQALQEMALSLVREHVSPARLRLAEESPQSHVPELWRVCGEHQLAGIYVSEEHGGVGAACAELVLVAEELGYGLAPVPLVATGVTAVSLLARTALAGEWLPRIATGEAIVVPALAEEAGTLDPVACTATPVGNGWTLSGEKWFVPYGGMADAFIVQARTGPGETALFLVVARDATVSRLDTLGLPPLYRLTLEQAPGRRLDGATLGAVLPVAFTALAAELAGAARHVLDHVAAYARERVQFDVPIGSFQAISHRCANIAADLACARLLVQRAAWTIDSGGDATAAACAARAYADRIYRRATQEAHQVLAGHGFVMENDLQLFYRHAPCAGLGFGTLEESWGMLSTALGC